MVFTFSRSQSLGIGLLKRPTLLTRSGPQPTALRGELAARRISDHTSLQVIY